MAGAVRGTLRRQEENHGLTGDFNVTECGASYSHTRALTLKYLPLKLGKLKLKFSEGQISMKYLKISQFSFQNVCFLKESWQTMLHLKVEILCDKINHSSQCNTLKQGFLKLGLLPEASVIT